MKIRILVMFLTFGFGLTCAKVWIACRRPAHQLVTVERREVLESPRSSQIATFTGGEFVSGFRNHYFSSDGAHISYGCFDQTSPARAAKALRAEIGLATIVERVHKLNEKGESVGSRVVVSNPNDMEPNAASIFWTEGTHLFTINAPSLKYAHEFEKWQAGWEYRGENCYRF